MTQKNPYLINTNKLPETATVSYYDVETDQNLKFEEWSKLHPKSDEITIINKSGSDFRSEKDGYGPCGDNYNCSCSCKWKSGCSCKFNWDIVVGEEKDNGKDGYDVAVFKGSAKGKIGWDGLEGKFKGRKSLFREKTSFDEIHYLSSSTGGSAKLDWEGNVTLKGELGFDLMNYEHENGVKTRVGLNADTGGSLGKDGIEAKFLGFGVSLGKKNGISTPLGEISKTNDDCVIQ